MVQEALHKWHTSVYARDHAYSLYGPSGILSDETIDVLSSIGPVKSIDTLQWLLEGQWAWYEWYGSEVYSVLSSLNIPPLVPKPKKTTNKCFAETEIDELDQCLKQ